jgi:branched-chain amino acid transport system substrate-binding protein
MTRYVCKPLLLAAASSVFFVACSTSDKVSRRPSRVPGRTTVEREVPPVVKMMPWETWQPFQDLNGQQLSNRSLILGDEYLQKGRRRSALEAYIEASKGSLLPREVEAATVRLASEYLAADQADKTLATVSSYFKKKGLSEDDVTPTFALLLGFAYGRKGDIDQAFAWFSRINNQQGGHGVDTEVARKGITLLVRSLLPEKFEAAAVNWQRDEFINQQFGRERLRRASQPGVEVVAAVGPFWNAYDDVNLAAGPLTPGPTPSGGDPVVGLLVSLSDKFSSLGKETKQGFELALEAAREEPKVKFVVRDVGSDAALVSSAVRELAGGEKASVIVGPLLTDAALVAARTARELNTPLISFSKSDAFRTGDGIFRLGATTTSQIDALMDAAFKDRRMTRFAVAYPQSAVGTEYLQVFKRKVESLGLTLMLEVSYSSTDDASMAKAAAEIEQSGAEAFLLPDTIEASARLLSNISPSVRRKIRPMGTAVWDNSVKIANSQALFEYAFYVSPFFPQSNRSVVKQFVDSYRGRYNSAPNFLAAQGFDTGTLVLAALRKSKSESIPFARALASLPPYDGVTGYITSQQPEGVSRAFYVVEVTKDAFLESMPGAMQQSSIAPLNTEFSFRGNQRVDPATGSPLLESNDRVDSGY